MKSRQIFFENLIAQNSLGGIPENYNFSGKTLYQIFEDLFSGTSFTEVKLEDNTGLEFNPSSELRTKYNTLIADGTLSQKIGNLNAKAASVWKTKTIVEVLDEILFPASLPTYTIPTLVLTDSLEGKYEVGTDVSNDLKLTGTKNDAGDFTSLRLYQDNSLIAENSSINPGLTATLNHTENFKVTPGVITWRGNGSYNQGVKKSDSQGNIDPRPYVLRQNAPQLGDDDFDSNITSIEGIYPYFYGVSSTPIDSAQIKNIIEAGNGNKTLIKADGTISIQFNANGQFLWFAHASIYPTKTKWQGRNSAINGGNIGSPTDFFGPSSIQQIISPEGSPNPYWTVDYKIYITKGRTSTQDGGSQYIIDLKNN